MIIATMRYASMPLLLFAAFFDACCHADIALRYYAFTLLIDAISCRLLRAATLLPMIFAALGRYDYCCRLCRRAADYFRRALRHDMLRRRAIMLSRPRRRLISLYALS